MQNRIKTILFLFFFISSVIVNGKEYLIKNVNIIDVEKGQVLENYFILIEDRIIKDVTKEKPDKVFKNEIDGKGKYAMPGLVNMYTHVSEDNLILYLYNGQTTVRDAPSHLTAVGLKDRIERKEIIGPRIFTVGLRATGMPAPYHGQQPVRTELEAREQVREAKRLSYDGMFIYGSCDAETYIPILSEAEKLNLPIFGHYPMNVNLEVALSGSQKSFDNLTGLTRRGELKFDKEKLLNGLLKSGKAIVPTLTVHKLWSLSNKKDSIFNAIPKEYIPHKMKANWLPVENGSGSYLYDKIQKLIKDMYDKGVKLFLGSDGGYPMVVNGFSFHEEIKNFYDLGIPTEEILRMITYKPAEFLGYNNLGKINKNYLADILLLNNNPLIDINNLKNINALFVQGDKFTKQELDEKILELKNNIEGSKDRFAQWREKIDDWKTGTTYHYSFLNNNFEVGEELINISKKDDRNFQLEGVNIMDGPHSRETFIYANVVNKKMDSLYIKCLTPEGIYETSISTNKTKAFIEGSAPYHGEFKYEEELYSGSLLLGPFSSRYYDLDIASNYFLALLLKRNLNENEADQLPVIQVELNSEEFGKKFIVDNSDYTILNVGDNKYKIIYSGFSGYRAMTKPSFVLDAEVNDSDILESIVDGNLLIKRK